MAYLVSFIVPSSLRCLIHSASGRSIVEPWNIILPSKAGLLSPLTWSVVSAALFRGAHTNFSDRTDYPVPTGPGPDRAPDQALAGPPECPGLGRSFR